MKEWQEQVVMAKVTQEPKFGGIYVGYISFEKKKRKEKKKKKKKKRMQYVESCGGLRGIPPHKHKREMERKTHSPTIYEKNIYKKNGKSAKSPRIKKKEKRKRKHKYPASTLEFG